jgi:hypothetical protein
MRAATAAAMREERAPSKSLALPRTPAPGPIGLNRRLRHSGGDLLDYPRVVARDESGPCNIWVLVAIVQLSLEFTEWRYATTIAAYRG